MSALPRTVCCALVLLACRHVGEGDASDTQDTLDSGETQHSAEDTGGDSDMLAVCVPDDGKIQVACPYTLPAEIQPVPYDTGDPNTLPQILLRTSWWVPFQDKDWDSASIQEWMLNYKEDPMPAVGAITCCVPSIIGISHTYGTIGLVVIGLDEDQTSCSVVFVYGGLGRLDAWDIEIPDWAGVLECNIPLPWDPPSWLYSSNSPLYGEIPAGCHPYIPQEGAPSRLPGLVGRDFFETLRSRAMEAL